MGFVKNSYLSSIDSGYIYDDKYSDKILCYECIANKALSNFIRANGSSAICDYCGNRRKAVNLNTFMPAIMSGINYSYSRANYELPRDYEEVGVKTYNIEDLLYEELYDEINARNDEILSDISNLIIDEKWCVADPFSDREEDTAFYDWQSFCKMVKENVRYMFYRAETDISFRDNPVTILDTIADYVERVKLVRKFDKNTKMYRCRTHITNEWLSKCSDFAPPPPEKATSGRMNAAGINVLYLALDPETALCETNVGNMDYATIASFRIKNTIRVLDLTKIKSMALPSIFDEDNRHKRSPMLFLQRFSETISQKRSNRDIDIDYVPTQIVTEFFRYVRTGNTEKYAGILYESTQNPGGKCVALFLNRDEVLNQKYGIHIIPNATTFYKKQFIPVNDNNTAIAKSKLVENVLHNAKISDSSKKENILPKGHNHFLQDDVNN